MELCSHQHEEIVYDPFKARKAILREADCPLCRANDRIINLERELKVAKDEIDALESQVT